MSNIEYPKPHDYPHISPFRFWCQKVLPLVYDDSLSYYELLCKVVEQLNKTAEDLNDMGEDITTLYNFVNNYFKNLDVQGEINNKLDTMSSDGTLSSLLEPLVGENSMPVIVTGVDAMSDKNKIYVNTENSHIYQYSGSNFVDTGVVYGESSNVVISSLIAINSDNYSEYNDADNYKQNLIYGISKTITSNMVSNLPHYNVTAILICVGYNGQNNSTGYTQIYVGVDGSFYTRVKITTGWSDWESSGVTPSFINLPENYTSADDLPANSIFGISASITEEQISNLPAYGVSAILMTLSQVTEGGLICQLYYGYNGDCFTRVKTSKGYSDWHSYGISPSFVVNISTNYSDANDVSVNRIYGIGTSITEDQVKNLPIYGVSGLLMSYSQVYSGGVTVQTFIGTNGCLYRRTKTSTGWTNWNSWDNMPRSFCNTCVDKPFNITNDTKICVFGDSITTTTHGGITWVSLIADKFSCSAVSHGVGSAVFDTNNSNNILAQINGQSDLTQYDIIFVSGGVNDAGSETPIDRFKSSVLATITTLKSKAPNAKLVYITPIRRGGYGGQNLQDYSGAICQLALSNGCSVINGFDFPIQPWSNEYVDEQTDGDGLHPNLTGKHIYAQSVLNALL